jgi:PAS domain S-box-containing protein
MDEVSDSIEVFDNAALRQDADRISAEIERADPGSDPFAAAVRATRMPMVVSNPRLPDNPIVFVNDSFCRLSGYSRAEIIGRNCRFLQGPDTDPAVVRRIRDAVHAGESIDCDIRNYRKDGEPFWNRLLLAPVHDAAGNITYFFASQVDVTLERERLSNLESRNDALAAEVAGRTRELAESEQRLRLALDAGELGAWELNLLENTTARSLRHDTILGYGELQPSWNFDRFMAHVPEEDRDIVTSTMNASLENQSIWQFRCRIRRAGDGAMRWIAARGRPVREADGSVQRVLGVIADVTDEVELETERRRLNETLELRVAERTRERDRIWRNSQDLLLVIDAAGMLLAVNPAWTSVLGHAPEALIRQDVSKLVHPDDLAAARTAVLHAASNVLPHFEIRLRHRDGSYRWLSWRASPEDGLIYAVGRDVTAEKDQTAALATAEDALRQSQKMEAVGQLTGGLAHDFNNLLTGIVGSLELLHSRASQGRMEELHRYIMAARGAADRAAALTHRLLAFSRRQTLEPKPVAPNRLIAGMAELIQRTIGPGVDFEVVEAAGLWTTLCDPNQLENALLNLSINARDAMPDGGRLTIETANAHLEQDSAMLRDLQPGQYVAVSVTDTGTGMPPAVAERAFDPFFTTKPIGQGTGLGLSMVYGFARQSNGHVRIYTEPGQGTTIKLFLPRYSGDVVDPMLVRTHVAPLLPAVGATVMVVDDEPTVRMLVADVLADMGYDTVEAAEGSTALRILQSDTRIDLLVTDVGLPGGMNGRQLADAARVTRPGLKVLFVTGYAENAAIGNLMVESGMHVMTKPFAMEALANRIGALLTK